MKVLEQKRSFEKIPRECFRFEHIQQTNVMAHNDVSRETPSRACTGASSIARYVVPDVYRLGEERAQFVVVNRASCWCVFALKERKE